MEQARAQNARVLEVSRVAKGFTYSKPIYYLEPWSIPGWAQREQTAIFLKKPKCDFGILGAGELREKRPDFVTMEKDARSSGIPGISMKKYHVHGEMPLGKFIFFIRHQIGLPLFKPLFVIFKNTEPSADALMSEVDEENRDEDEFLHMTYSGEASSFGSINH